MQPFQQRVVDEKRELDKKLDSLHEFLGTSLYKALSNAEQHRMARQHNAMCMYSGILAERIEAFNKD
jgi:hypothetical protein